MKANDTMDQTKKVPSPVYQSEKNDLANSIEEGVQYHELLGDIVEKLVADSKPKSCSTPDTTKKTTPRGSFSSSTPTLKTSQTSRRRSTEILNRNEANIQSSAVPIQNTNEEISECINFVCVLIFGIMGFGVFIVLLEFVPNSNLTAALSVVGACMLLVFIFGFMRIFAKNRTPLNRR